MKSTAERTAEKEHAQGQTIVGLLVVLAIVVAGVLGFLNFYYSYIDQTLYAERLNQMREVTAQLFTSLETVADSRWRTVEEQNRVLQDAPPETLDDLITFMQHRYALADFAPVRTNLIAVDADGRYYMQTGPRGLLYERSYLLSSPERLNYVFTGMTSGKTYMVFLKRLPAPISLRDGNGTTEILYYGIAQEMEELEPYFKCSAYGNHSAIYVVDNAGLKLFSSSDNAAGALIRGYNVFNALETMQYLHGSTFEATQTAFESANVAYSNAVIGDTEVYYAIYRMSNAAWTLVFLVPSEYVATNTVELVQTTIRFVIIFACVLITIAVASIYLILQAQQREVLSVGRKNSAMLEKLNAELIDANNAKSEFLSNMSHDIRTPMNAIVGIAQLMEHDRDDPEKLEGYIQKIQASSRHLLGLINDVLDMSRIESNKVVLNTEPIDLADQIRQIDSIIRPEINERGQHFTIRIDSIAHEHLIGDSVRLRQIFLNFLSNAAKYTGEGGDITFELAELPCDTAGRAAFRGTVTDNGCGMTPEFLAHIFEPFTRAENSVTNKVQGTGLGMAITKSIVDMMGGTITVESKVGEGSRFEVTFTLPIDPAAAPATDIRHMLLLTADAGLLRNIRAAAETMPITLAHAADADAALELLKQQKTDVILFSGFLGDPALGETVSRLRAAGGEGVPIFCCDYAQDDQAQEAAAHSGADGFLQRPFFFSDLLRALEGLHKTTADGGEGASSLRGMRFLCAEDNSLNAEILEAILDLNGASCVIYKNGRELVDAFAAVTPGQFDAILMDVQMPVMNGLEATKAIRNGANPLGKTIPIIAMTANAFTADVEHCLAAGMDAHVAKPLDIRALERAMYKFTPPPENIVNDGNPPA